MELTEKHITEKQINELISYYEKFDSRCVRALLELKQRRAEDRLKDKK